MFVRTAGERDLEAIRTLLAETWHATYDAIYGPQRVNEITAEWHSMASLRARLTHPHSEFLVADDGEAISGMAFATAIDDGKLVLLRQLYVLPQKQGAGVGAMLLEEIEQCFPEARMVRVEVERENAAAVSFYRARGFSDFGRPAQTHPEVSILVMEKPLA
ncbi:GNAT family N-acetyltransferase [Aquamicrobium ahrensii]|uniref:GNAT superfamily N-acetyltransferase n=1 Tax=Aquamicrobium ahrensii TaxID=469551 RepID=A0ABV2KJY8_9HYPH